MQGKQRAMIILIGSALVAIAAIALISATRAGAASKTSPLPVDPTILTRTANNPPVSGNGVPAIKPHLSGSGPSFTASDARTYVTEHGIARMEIQKPIHVTLVLFANAGQIQKQYTHISFGLSPDQLICFVEIHNTITISNPMGKIITFSHGFVIFDAHTGNELGSGAFN